MKNIDLIAFEFLIMHLYSLTKKHSNSSVRNYVKYLTAVKVIDKKTVNRVINFQKICKRKCLRCQNLYVAQRSRNYGEVN